MCLGGVRLGCEEDFGLLHHDDGIGPAGEYAAGGDERGGAAFEGDAWLDAGGEGFGVAAERAGRLFGRAGDVACAECEAIDGGAIEAGDIDLCGAIGGGDATAGAGERDAFAAERVQVQMQLKHLFRRIARDGAEELGLLVRIRGGAHADESRDAHMIRPRWDQT